MVNFSGTSSGRIRHTLLRSAVVVIAGLNLVCARTSPQANGPVKLRIGTSLPRAGEPSTGVNGLVNSVVLEAPITIGADGRLVGRAFENWTWLQDGRGLRLFLRPGITFHDGTPLTADLAATILRREFASGAISTTVRSVTAVGDREVVITSGQSEGFLLSDVATAMFSLPGKERVGIGPFQFESAGPPIVLRAYDAYYTGRPAIDRIEIAEYETPRATWAALMRGDINMVHDVSREALDFVEAESTVQTHSFLRAYYYALVFNMRHPILGRREVRLAIGEAIDKAGIVERRMRNRGQPADGPVWPLHWAATAAARRPAFNPDAARLRLDSLDLKVRPPSEPGVMPSRFRFKCAVVAEDQTLQRIALLVQKNLFDLGVDMDVEMVPFRDLRRRAMKGEFDTLLLEISSSRSLSYIYYFWHSPQGQPVINSGYNAADHALDRFRAAISDADVRAALADLQQVMCDDPPAVFIAWTQTARALTRDFVVPDEGPRDILGTIRQWRPAPPDQVTRR